MYVDYFAVFFTNNIFNILCLRYTVQRAGMLQINRAVRKI